MRILIDILHPAHVHFFRFFLSEMRERGHHLLVTARDKDMTVDLLHSYGIPFELLSHESSGRLGSAAELAVRTTKLARYCRETRPDLVMGIMGVSIAPVARFLPMQSAVFYDTEVARTTNRWVFPMADCVVTPECYTGPVRGNHITYRGYHELAYLHPNRFQPDNRQIEGFGLDPEEPYIVVRMVSRSASHDIGHRWMSEKAWREVIGGLGTRGRVVISSEDRLPADLEHLTLRGPVDRFHDLLAHASLVFGESATMSSEAAVLGVPACYVGSESRGYIDDISARYGLIATFHPEDLDLAIRQAHEFLEEDRSLLASKRDNLLSSNVDVTSWMVDWVEKEFSSW